MPYASIDELPPSLKSNLPKDAKEVYLTVYNNTWGQHANATDRRIGATPEDIAHRTAWGAVRDKFRKQGDEWVRKYGY